MTKKTTIEQALLGTTKHMQPNEAFVQDTMQKVKNVYGAGTFERAIRTTSTTKKESLFMKLKLLPRFAIIGLTAVSVVAVSGGAYAAYQAWQQPRADVVGLEQIGNREALLVALDNCGGLHQGSTQIRAVVSKRSTLTADEAAKAIQAYCELAAIGGWASQTKHVSGNAIVLPYTITAIHADSIEVRGEHASRTVAITSDTVFLAQGMEVAKTDLKPGDTMTVITQKQGTDQTGPALAVVKLDLPFQYYKASTMQHVYQADPCVGNPEDTCVNAPSRDVYPYGKEGGALAGRTANLKHLQGKLTSISGSTFTLQTTSGKTVTVSLADALRAFDARNPDMGIEVGDTLNLRYTGNSLSLTAEHVSTISLLMDGNAKTGAIQKF